MVTLQFIPYHEISGLNSDQRIKKILSAAKSNKIVLLNGRLKKQEEAKLIEKTMESINSRFKGIELAVINPGFRKLKTNLSYKNIIKYVTHVLLGNRSGMTVIGPATIVKKIKKDPNKIELFTKEQIKKQKRTKKRVSST